MLVDAPRVLGRTRWTEIGNRYNIGLVRALLTDAVESGRVPAQPIEATADPGAQRQVTVRCTSRGAMTRCRGPITAHTVRAATLCR